MTKYSCCHHLCFHIHHCLQPPFCNHHNPWIGPIRGNYGEEIEGVREWERGKKKKRERG